MRRAIQGAFLAAVLLGFTPVGQLHASQVVHRTMADLIDLSEHILLGDVVSLSDGFDRSGYPFTEVTLSVRESMKGSTASQYTFRQFGLLEPKTLSDGQVYAGVSPEGWPQFVIGETVMVFLYVAGNETGFRTTVGLSQGKFTIVDGSATNAIGNRGLFQNLVLDERAVSKETKKLMQSQSGPVNARTLAGFVKKAVVDNWIEKGALRYENR
ncbi:MAG: hypothetical protein HKN21_12670 [Candidatus Eisenbacteria bacterium]|uniref:Uncharacterized protein n=1 Tax=Eiseniibacteriota bacterium TaxID=2212470 RepID=A0A7Y2E9A7_UNCEI|nr:hypothetical protein [Candidatus Eisenbacteria bacterium]